MASGAASQFGIGGVVARVLLSLFLVFATYNPSGRSYYDWALLDGPILPRVVVGLVLLGAYISLLYAVWEVIGFSGMFVMALICLSIAWWLDEIEAIDLANDGTLGLVMCITLSMVIAWGMSFSFLFARLTGIIHTRGSIH